MSVCAKFQLSSWSRSGLKVWGAVHCGNMVSTLRQYGGFQVTTMSNLNEVAFELLWVELSSGELHWVLTITFKEQEINNYLTTAVRAIMGPSLNPKKGRRPFTEKKNNELKWQLGYSQLIDQYKVLEAAKHLPILRNPAHPKVLLICWSSHFTALLKKNRLQNKKH